MILNCAIVDDEPLALELLQSYVEKTAFLRLAGKYSSAVQAMNEIPAHEEIHILFPTQSILPLIFYLVLMGIKSLKKTLLIGFQTSLKKYL